MRYSYQRRRHQICTWGSWGRISTQTERQRPKLPKPPRHVFSATRRTYRCAGNTGTEPRQNTKFLNILQVFLMFLLKSLWTLCTFCAFCAFSFFVVWPALPSTSVWRCLGGRFKFKCFKRGGYMWSQPCAKMNSGSFYGARKNALDMPFLDYDMSYAVVMTMSPETVQARWRFERWHEFDIFYTIIYYIQYIQYVYMYVAKQCQPFIY